MDIVGGVVRAVTATASATTTAAGAVGGAALGGAMGSVRGTMSGIREGARAGSRSTPVAAATLGVMGATGFVEWPVLLAVGGAALVLRRLDEQQHAKSNGAEAASQPLQLVETDESAKTAGTVRSESTEVTSKAPARSQGTSARKPRARKSTSSTRSRSTPRSPS